MKTKILILFDKKNKTPFFYFKKKLLRNRNYKIVYSFKKSSIKKFNIIFIIGFTSKVKINNNKKYYTIHESPLPKGRGCSPIKNQILRNKKKITCCLIRLNNKIDNGNIISKKTFKIKDTDFYDEIKEAQMKTTIALIKSFLKKYPNIIEKKQKGKTSYFKKLSEESDKININKPLITQLNKIRSTNYHEFDNFFIYKNQKFIIKIYKK
jgi:methionyl-tRNA formyltransferase